MKQSKYENKQYVSMSKKEYLLAQYTQDEQTYKNHTIKTGFKNIDKDIRLQPSVYLFGGIPSIGKTTFTVQLIDQIAQSGNPVLFISLEQSEFELTCKSLKRIECQSSLKRKQAIETYSEYADNITTVTSKQTLTMTDIENIVIDYINENQLKLKNKLPVVVIDYLQMIQSNSLNTREGTNDISKAFVALKKKYNLVLFILSSLNRSNYMNQIDFESFKESGNLEYDADVVLGLQYQMMSTDRFDTATSISSKRRMLHDAKIESIRQVEIVCLKNRNGKLPDKWLFEYYTDSDTFIPVDKDEDKRKKRTTYSF